MPRRYSPEEKIAALVRLAQNRGSVTATSRQLGIPVRTLRDWQCDSRLNAVVSPSPPPPTPSAGQRLEELPPFEDDLAAVNYLRHHMLDELLNMARQLPFDFAVATPYQRMNMIPQLLDRLMKLDQHLKPYQHLVEDVEYEIVGAETFERRSYRPDEELEFFLLEGEQAYGPFEAKTLKQQLESFHARGQNPTIGVQFLRRIDNKYVRDWHGTLSISVPEASSS